MKGEIGKHEPNCGTKAAAKNFGSAFPGSLEKNKNGSAKKSASAAAKKKNGSANKNAGAAGKRKRREKNVSRKPCENYRKTKKKDGEAGPGPHHHHLPALDGGPLRPGV